VVKNQQADYQTFSRRERQIVDAVHRLGAATAREIQDSLDDAPTYSAVRSALRILTEKGVLVWEYDGKRYVYRPAAAPRASQKGALDHLIDTFFGGSPARTFAALLARRDLDASDEDLARLETMVKNARQKRRRS
jgi:predicted transcriptional regulator